MFVTADDFHPCPIFQSKARVYPSGAHYGLEAPALIRLGCKWIAVTNVLDYNNEVSITDFKSFIASTRSFLTGTIFFQIRFN